MTKACELCGERATLYCSADDANLCWSCDAKVHGANFLVARHTRLLLCTICSGESECRTSAPHPPPLSRLCAHCDPAHVLVASAPAKSPVTLELDLEQNDDSEDLRAPSFATGAGGESCASQESHNDAHSSVEDEKVATDRKCLTEGSMRVRKERGRRRVTHTKRSRLPGLSRRVSCKRAMKSRSSRAGSIVIV